MADWQIGLLPARPLRPSHDAPKKAVSCRVTANQPRPYRRASSRCWSACWFWAAAAVWSTLGRGVSRHSPRTVMRSTRPARCRDFRPTSRSLINSGANGSSPRCADAMCCCTSFMDPASLSVRSSSSNCANSGLSAAQRSRLAILSISVDLLRDTTERLHNLWREEGAFAGWIMAQPADGSIDQVTREFGIWVFAKNDGTINHSADLFLIDPAGRIVRVISPQANTDRMRSDLEKYL